MSRGVPAVLEISDLMVMVIAALLSGCTHSRQRSRRVVDSEARRSWGEERN